jgi:hypothetical protein
VKPAGTQIPDAEVRVLPPTTVIYGRASKIPANWAHSSFEFSLRVPDRAAKVSFWRSVSEGHLVSRFPRQSFEAREFRKRVRHGRDSCSRKGEI